MKSPAAETGAGSSRVSDAADRLVLPAVAASAGFQKASRLVLDYLNRHMPMGFWSITRVENDRQTYLYLDDNDYGLRQGGSHPWRDSYCVHMAAGIAPRIAPDAQAVTAYAGARINKSAAIAAYAGAPIAEPDGKLFGAICGIDPRQRPELAAFGPVLDLLAELLSLALASDRALHLAERASTTALTKATTDALTGIHNRHGWEEKLTALDRDYATYADPTVIVIADLDNLKTVNDGPGGHAAGDDLLRNTAAVMRSHIRDHDFVARLGGDEFGVILTNCPTDLAPTLAGRISHALHDAGIPASLGWAPLTAGADAQRAVELADHAMYQVKTSRRTTAERNT
jgi:diguanylate cyclase (GGDEF)-like protein